MLLNIINFLRRVDINTLRELAGETVLKAIEEVRPGDMSRTLAEIIFLKQGHSIFHFEGTGNRPGGKEVRKALIDVLTEDEANALRDYSCISPVAETVWDDLQNYFKSFSETKSRSFVLGLGLDEGFIKINLPDERESVVRVEANYGEKLTSKGYLHPFQKLVKDEVTRQISKEGDQYLMVQMPTGAGKTFTALETFVDMLRMPFKERFYVWVVDSNELAEQSHQAFVDLWKMKGDRPLQVFRFFGGYGVDSDNLKDGVVFASFATLFSILERPDHKYYRSLRNIINRHEVLIVDEAHKSVAHTYSEVIDFFTQKAGTKLIGLSATPGRNSQAGDFELTNMFACNLVRIMGADREPIEDPLRHLQQKGYLAELEVDVMETEVNLDARGVNEQQMLASLACHSGRNQAILEQIKEAHESENSTLVFSCTLDHVFALKILCASEDIPCELIVGSTPAAQRIDILKRFKDGEYFILINFDILSTGIDLPNVDQLIITRPIGSPMLYSQIVGRALRGPKNGGNTQNKIVSLKDNILNFGNADFLFEQFTQNWL